MNQAVEDLLTTRRFKVVRQYEPDASGQMRPREYVAHPGAVTIIPLLADGRVVLIRNRRVAVGATLVELPAGTIDPGEQPEQTARRELTEETGYRGRNFKLLCEFHTSPGILSERMFLYLATDLEEGVAALEPGEKIEPWVVPWADAMAMVDRGEIHDGKTLVGLMLYERMRCATD